MANYVLNRYHTGLQSSVAEASALLEARIEAQESTTNVLVGSGIVLTRRDGERCVGWALFTGLHFFSAEHALVSDNITLTTNA
jgi:hypothetical protein